MATETVSRLDAEECLTKGRHFVALAQWIEGARKIIEDVELGRKVWPDLNQALRDRDICTGHDWGEYESTGLVYLMQEVESYFCTLYDERFPPRPEIENNSATLS